MTSWTLKSIPPHDWFICLDIDPYFDYEHDPEKIFEAGYIRPIPLEEREIIVTTYFNGDPENPEFHFESQEELSKSDISEANRALSRIFGTDLDLRPLYENAINDPVLGSKLSEFYGLKRMARATLFDDVINRIIQMRLSHKPTAKKMVYKVREAYGTHLTHEGRTLPAWPRPFQLVRADPAQIRKLGPTLKKGEYITGIATDLISGELDFEYLDKKALPSVFYEKMMKIRGIGPTSAQDLMLFRPRTDALFPSNMQKGEEKGLRKWIIMSYGADPSSLSERDFRQLIHNWKGYEAAALEFLFVNWIISQKKKSSV